MIGTPYYYSPEIVQNQLNWWYINHFNGEIITNRLNKWDADFINSMCKKKQSKWKRSWQFSFGG